MINIVIPMAGAGTRFMRAGYRRPKPFIDVFGIPMIYHVLENLNIRHAKFILIIRKEHLESEIEIIYEIQCKYNVEFILVDEITEGAACTVLHAHSLINNDTPLLIANADQIVDIDISDYINHCKDLNLDGSILTFFENDAKWRYAKLDKNGLISIIKEKEVISDFATAGIYYFSKGQDFVENAIDMLIRNNRVNNEFYVAPVYNYAIEKGGKFCIYNIKKEQMHTLGTPDDLNKYIQFKKHETLV